MAEALGRPPSLKTEAVSSVIYKYFNFKNILECSIKSLPSFEDRNIYFQGEASHGNCSEFILKLNNPLCTPAEVIKGLNAVMNHVKSCNFQFETCYPLPCKDGTDVLHLTAAELTGESGDVEGSDHKVITKEPNSWTSEQPELRYHVRVLPFISGEVFDSVDKKFLTPMLLQEVGEMIGKVDKELKVSATTMVTCTIDNTVVLCNAGELHQ